MTPNHSPEPTWTSAVSLRLSIEIRHVTVPTWLTFGRRPLHAMRAFIILFLTCISAFAEDTGIRMTTSVSTNAETGAICREETFTRNGQTNLVRITKTEHGVLAARTHRFYHAGEFVAVHLFVTRPAKMAREMFTTAESSYSVGLDFSPTKEIERVIVTRKKGNVLDGFTATNGVFYPVSNADLEIRPIK